jgi:hypothetical protein
MVVEMVVVEMVVVEMVVVVVVYTMLPSSSSEERRAAHQAYSRAPS